MPVHTAYAVPIGNVKEALYKRNILILKQTKKPIIQKIEVFPEVSLALPKQDANPTSNNPAIIKRIQFISKRVCHKGSLIVKRVKEKQHK